MNVIKEILGKSVCTVMLVLLISVFSNTVQAQEEAPSQILSLLELTIKPNHDSQFQAGVKAWTDCYLENEGEWTWNMWSRMQGEGNVYVLSSFMGSWAELDADDEAGKKCRGIVEKLINPNIKKAERNYARTMPEFSKAAPVENGVISVTFWRINNSTKFINTVTEVTDAIRSSEGEPRGYWYDSYGGSTAAPHYFVVVPYANFAAMDQDRDMVWTVVEDKLGANKRKQLQADFRDAVDQSWSYMFRKVDELSRPMTAE